MEASRACLRSILADIGSTALTIHGLGVTGLGRHIAGLHTLTDGVINEIIAHATAAAFFDPEVDTIFEIGGQDAGYTSLTNAVASDCAMNEACSAGTGSFPEESAYESSIRNAVHDGLSQEHILAGRLVYWHGSGAIATWTAGSSCMGA